MLSMKKTVLATAVAATLGVSGAAQAGTAGITGVWDFAGSFTMRDPTGAIVGAVDNSVTGGFDFGAGTATLATTTPFFGFIWAAHDITFSDNGDGTYSGSMLFDWSTNLNIPVNILWDITDNGDGTATVVTLDGNGDGIPGIPMATPPFQGFNAAFDGTLTVVPVPAAVWLFGSGLIGLAGVARRRKGLQA